MNVDRAVRRLFVASDKGCTIPYSAEESVLRELKCVMALLVLAIIVVGIVGQIILVGGV